MVQSLSQLVLMRITVVSTTLRPTLTSLLSMTTKILLLVHVTEKDTKDLAAEELAAVMTAMIQIRAAALARRFNTAPLFRSVLNQIKVSENYSI